MTFPDLVADLKATMPELRGRLMANQSLAELTWFRVGGPAQALFMPEDEADLAYFLAHLSDQIPITVIGLGSNLIVRDGGVPGVVIRLGRGFNAVTVEPGARMRAGAAVPDVRVARAAQEAGISGLAFLRGIPGAIGGGWTGKVEYLHLDFGSVSGTLVTTGGVAFRGTFVATSRVTDEILRVGVNYRLGAR